jgi:hypothetical protein
MPALSTSVVDERVITPAEVAVSLVPDGKNAAAGISQTSQAHDSAVRTNATRRRMSTTQKS